ncbi:MAG TPA: ABC transporter substrate-binding protein [Stellaceae bacterium]|nr:ABC transporter substrate-binding protein [Stellaceae bacterium]
MKRREVIILLGGAVAWPLAVRADQRMKQIGVLTTNIESDPDAQARQTVFRGVLKGLGWEEGRNLEMEYRWAGEDQTQLQRYATELVRLAPDVLLSEGSPALSALHRETHTIPIVFVRVSDPVKIGLIDNLAHPGGNITGFANFEHSMGGKWLDLIKETAPDTTRVAVIFDPDNPFSFPYLQAIEAAAPSAGIELTRAEVRDAADIESAINAFAHQPNGGLVVLPNTHTILHRDLIIELAARHRLPAIYPYRVFASAGGFISYGIDAQEQYRRAASYIDRILKGAKPADLPVQLPDKFELVVNLKTAKELGLTVPQSFLLHVDEVIE